ncbi:MAG TPA: VOC family protein [Halieaceae bacterium]|nr:VOC family protein [Halieaceae bacterium]
MNAPLSINSTLHHNAYVTRDLEAVRRFYEEVIGYPLVATWAEKTDLFGKVRTYVHCFFDIGDGSCLAFFQFADEDDAEEFGPELPPSGFRHLAMKVDQATQDGIRDRLVAAGYEEPQFYILNHGYCYSLYVFDPAGLLVEFTVDHDDVEQINADKKRTAHADLERWLAGDHTPNNEQFHR